MDKQSILELMECIGDKLETLDIYQLDANLFVYDIHGRPYESFNEVTQDILNGRTAAFMEIEAFLGDDVWERLETGSS